MASSAYQLASEVTRRIPLGAVTDGRWRKHLKGLRERLGEAHRSVGRRLLHAHSAQ